MKCDFLGQRNRLLPDTIVWDEGLKLWRVIANGLITLGAYSSMQDAIDEVDGCPRDRFITSTQTPEDFIKAMKIHPSIVKAHLTKADGTFRIPTYQEWTEDFGMGYANRLAWEQEQGEYTT